MTRPHPTNGAPRDDHDGAGTTDVALPRWDTSDLHASFDARSFTDAMERVEADASRLEALFDRLEIRGTAARPVTAADGAAADEVIRALNAFGTHTQATGAFIYAATTTNSYDERAEGLLAQFEMSESRERPLLARFAEWLSALGVDALATVSTEVTEHRGPLRRLAERAAHQMSEAEEHLYAELAQTGSKAWDQLHSVVTSQLRAEVTMPDGRVDSLPMAAVRGLASHGDAGVRKAAYDAEQRAWPTVAPVCAAAMNGVKGEANVVNRRRGWSGPLEASWFANSVSRATYEAMHEAVTESLPDFHRWMRSKAALHGHEGALPWWDMFAPLPFAPGSITWAEGLDIVRTAFSSYGGQLAGLVDRAVDGRWIDAGPRDGKQGGAFCMPFIDDRSLVFLNWSGSVDAAQTAAHELGHAYHNTQLAARTPLQRQLPMTLAETASIFCETLVVEEALQRLEGRERLVMLDVDLQGSTQVAVDIRSRLLFESAVFERRRRRTLGVSELNEMMRAAQAEAYGDGLDQSTAHPYMWAVKPHYYGAHFYNWPYTFGLLFGLGLYAEYRADPARFSAHYDDALSRAGIDSAEHLGDLFGFDISDIAFWRASLDVVRGRIDAYARLAADLGSTAAPEPA